MQFLNCFNILFFDYGYWMIGVIVYNMYFVINELECCVSCRDDFICWGFIYCEDNMICFLSYDKMFIDVLLCVFCCFYEKIC